MHFININNMGVNIHVGIDFLDNPVSDEIRKNLPLSSSAQVWGDEIYFETEITAPSDGATLDVVPGDVAYWPGGKCLCLFFGPTPMSKNDKPVPASEVVVVAKADINPEILREIKDGDEVTVE